MAQNEGRKWLKGYKRKKRIIGVWKAFERFTMFSPGDPVSFELNRWRIAPGYLVKIKGRWLTVQEVNDNFYITDDGAKRKFGTVEDDFEFKYPSKMNLIFLGFATNFLTSAYAIWKAFHPGAS